MTDANGVCGRMDSSATVFVDELSFCWGSVALDFHLQLTLDRPFKKYCPAPRVFSRNLTKQFKGLASGFAELDADSLLDVARCHAPD
jgi:hypothetical protein